MTRETVRRRRGSPASSVSVGNSTTTTQRSGSIPNATATPTANATTSSSSAASEQPDGPTTTESSPKTVQQLIEEEDKSFSQFLALCAIVTFIFFYMIKTTELPPKRRVYAVIIDAGSTGTRAQIFQFIHNTTENRLVLRDTKMHFLKKSIAALGTGVSGTGNQFFKPLLENVKKGVPGVRRRKRTPIVLGATAGLRLLGDSASQLSLTHSRKALNSTEFMFEHDYVSILDEKDEAVFGWTTVNFLLGRIGGGKKTGLPVATMELGGGSMQIVYSQASAESDDESDAKKKRATQTVRVMGEKYELNAKSHLGLGLYSFMKVLMNLFEREGVLQEGNPCYRKGKTFRDKQLRLGVEGTEQVQKVTIVGDGDFKHCVASVEIAIASGFEGVEIAPLPKGTIVYAFAYFYDKTVGLGLPNEPTQQKLWEMGMNLCESEEEKFGGQDSTVVGGSASDEACSEFAYVYAIVKMITENFSKERAVKLKFEQYVDGHMLGWSLGAALKVVQPTMFQQISLDNEPLTM